MLKLGHGGQLFRQVARFRGVTLGGGPHSYCAAIVGNINVLALHANTSALFYRFRAAAGKEAKRFASGLLPGHVGLPGAVVGHASEHKQQIRQAVEIGAHLRVDFFLEGQGHRFPFAATADGAG